MAQTAAQRQFGPAVSPAAAARADRALPGRAAAGWTLVEAMIALALVGLTASLAVPAYGEWIANYRLASHAERLAGSLALARSEAVKRGHRVNLCPAPDGLRCDDGASWDAGWLVYVDVDRDGRVGDDEPVLRAERAADAGIHVRANRPVDDYVSFTSLGSARLLGGGLQMGTFTVCRRGLPARKVVLANSGRVRLEKSQYVCTD